MTYPRSVILARSTVVVALVALGSGLGCRTTAKPVLADGGVDRTADAAPDRTEAAAEAAVETGAGEVADDASAPPDADASAEASAPDARDDSEGGDASDASDVGDGGLTCAFGSAVSLSTNTSLDLFGTVVYFDDGAVLPAGRYRVTYLDGCMKYSSGQDWTIHAYADGHDAWWLVGDTTAAEVVMPPGIVGWAASNGAFADFAACVAANLTLPPVEFDFAGGKLGIWLKDSPYSDNLAGENGRNPKWKLDKLGSCTASPTDAAGN